MNFLLVDENENLLRFLSTYLGTKGHLVSWLSDPQNVQLWLSVNQCDVVITYLSVVVEDGYARIQMIRKEYPLLPIIVFTNYGYDRPMMRRCAELGANGYVSKGHGPTEIHTRIMRMLTVP
jgi:DNA-binding response OmpR family regulator